ncbi:MAG: phospholipase D-like domain-containing protein [Cyanobium sp.]
MVVPPASPRSLRCPPLWLASLASLLFCAGCSSPSVQRSGAPTADLPLPPGIRVAFNHRSDRRYRSPLSGQWRQGDDLEALILEAIRGARREILVAVQELSLPAVAEALVERQRQGVTVRLVLENTYSQPWSQQHEVDLDSHARRRVAQLRALGAGDAVAILQKAAVPMLDDTADGSAGSGLMHHKFMVVDRRLVVTGSANFTPSCIHGDPDDPRTRGNVNHLLRLESESLAAVFAAEFARLWGDGPGGRTDSRFGVAKGEGRPQRVRIGPTTVEVLFSPHRRGDPFNGLLWLEQQLGRVQRDLDLSLFVFSGQNLADSLARLRQQGVRLRVLVDPGFAWRSYSEVLDLLGVSLSDSQCRLEAGNRPWQQAIETAGSPRLPQGDKLHHKFAILDRTRVISGSFNWSPSAAFGNDETLMRIDSPLLAAHFRREMDRLWRNADLGVSPRLQRRWQRQRQRCGSGRQLAAATPSTIALIPRVPVRSSDGVGALAPQQHAPARRHQSDAARSAHAPR